MEDFIEEALTVHLPCSRHLQTCRCTLRPYPAVS